MDPPGRKILSPQRDRAYGVLSHVQCCRSYGEQLRAVFDNVVVAEYRCHYNWRTRQVQDIRDGVFYLTRYASSQGALIPFNPQESLVLYRPQSGRRHARKALPPQQLLLFEWIPTA
jgi:hypothetical protein